MELKPGIYKHYKGNLYRVWGVVRHSETQQDMVLYQALYGEFGLWVRPLPMFLETVDQGGKTVLRFAPIETTDQADNTPLLKALSESFL